MPRRPSKKAATGSRKPRAPNRADAKINKWNTTSDIPMDEEDQFHASRDKILLEGDYEGDEDGDEDEVFALKGMSDDEEEDDQEGYEDVDMDEDEELEVEDRPAKKKKSAKSKKKGKGAESSSSSGESESEEETWGRGKAAYYSSNAAQLESDDEEGNDLEEQEAIRLQAKQRDELGDADFGLEDPQEVETTEDTPGMETPAISIQSLPSDKKSLIRHLEKTDPESLALARDWSDTAQSLTKTRQQIKQLEAESSDAVSLGMIHLYYQALLSYAATLAFYLHLRADEKYARRPELLKSHPIISRLLVLKQSLITLEDLDFAASDSEEDGADEDDDMLIDDARELWANDRGESLDRDELNQLIQDAIYSSDEEAPKKKAKAKKPSADSPPKKKRKTAKAALPVFDLVEPVFTSSKASSSRPQNDSVMADAYGELTSLQAGDAADKSARRKSLRFHTSKIESASARRRGARNAAVGGDDDLPYRERRPEKEARAVKEAQAKVKSQGGADLDDVEPEPKGKRKMSGDDSDGGEDEEGADGYYELIKRKSKEKKEQKKAEYEANHPRFEVEDDDGASGPRSLTRAILANKGLTPHRPKSVRNPRVKKRLKFEKAKKKISSQKAVYKGGVGATGRYEGEKSGISKVVKSIRLG